MKLVNIKPGMAVKVRRGYSVRPATVERIDGDGRVHVTFTDTSHEEARRIGPNRQYYFGATVRPNQIEEVTP